MNTERLARIIAQMSKEIEAKQASIERHRKTGRTIEDEAILAVAKAREDMLEDMRYYRDELAKLLEEKTPD